MSADIQALLSTPVVDWTSKHEAQFTEALCTTVAAAAASSYAGEAVRISIPCTDASTVAHYTQVCDRILTNHSDVLLTAGRTWKDKKVMEWVFDGNSEQRKKKIAEHVARAQAMAIAVAKLKAEAQIQADAEAKAQGQG